MPLTRYIPPITNMGFHNLCTHTQPPLGTKQLLGYNLKFCIQKPLPTPDIETTVRRLRASVRTSFAVADFSSGSDASSDYNPKLYIKSDTWDPPAAPLLVEDALHMLREQLTQASVANRNSRQYNLSHSDRQLLQKLRSSRDFIIVSTDKNLGPAIMNRDFYKLRALKDHLLDNSSYKRLSPTEAQNLHTKTSQDLSSIVDTHQKTLSDADKKYFKRSFDTGPRRLPQFYTMPKVHKEVEPGQPPKTRPVVSCIKSKVEIMSKYLDYQLQRVVHLCPSYLKDSSSLLRNLKQQPKLPPGSTLLSADAVSMYTNIDTQHGIASVSAWLHRHTRDLPSDFNIQMVTEALAVVMQQNVFQFDDTFWIQTTGTAMGTSVACVYATIYYSQHEETLLLPKYQHNDGPLLFYKRFIDDTFLIWTPKVPFAPIESFLQDLPFGNLTWTADPPSDRVNFLDLTLSISNGYVTSKTYVKDHNLHLYLPPTSAHAPGVLKSLIFGNLQRYWNQNTHTSDYTKIAKAFRLHLLARGHSEAIIDSIFLEAASHIDKRSNRTCHPSLSKSQSKLFLHWEYHPRDIPQRQIRSIFMNTCGPVFSNARSRNGKTPDLGRLTVAYSRPKNLGNILCRTTMSEPPGERVSDTLRALSPATPSP